MSDFPTSNNSLFESIRSISEAPTEETFAAIETQQVEILPLLLSELEAFSAAPDAVARQGNDYIRHILSPFILAWLRNKDAYPILIKLISQPGEKIINLTGEVFTEALGRILASVYDGNLKPIMSVIENAELNPWIRSAALDSLTVLWQEDVLSREDLVEYLKELMQGKIERVTSYVWDNIALIAYDLHPGDLEALLSEAIEDRLIAPMVLNQKSLKASVADDMDRVLKNKDKISGGYIKSPVQELTWWLYPDRDALDKGMEYASVAVPLAEKKVEPGERVAPMGWRPDTVVRTTTKVGRNESCPCGSGKKYKKCCGAN